MAGICPKCGSPRNPGPECGKCGVIYAKAEQQVYYDRRESAKKIEKPVESRLKPCPACKKDVSKTAPSCPHCGEPLQNRVAQTNNLGSILGISGSLLLGFGSFSPMVSIPIIGTLNFFKNGQGDGVIFLILAITALIVAALKKYRPLLWLGVAATGVVAYDLFNAVQIIETMKTKATTEFAGNPFGGIGEMMAQSVQLQWGWVVVIAGACAIIAGSSVGLKQEARTNCAQNP